MARNCADVAATLHAHLCECDRHGYTWDARWGVDGNDCYVDVGGETFALKDGDRDCSSSICDAWQEALRGTVYEGQLDAATYTGNMKYVFCASGLFDWMPMSFTAQRGDIYLNEANHTAMCQSPSPDMLSEFCQNENGGCYGGSQGDQTGGESHITDFYDFPFDGILHYNGGADGETGGQSASNVPDSPAEAGSGGSLLYNAMTAEDGWLDTMDGLTDTGGSGDDYAGILGHAVTYLAIDASCYRVCTEEGGWLDTVDHRDLGDLVYGAAGDGSPVLAVDIADEGIGYQVNVLGGDWFDGRMQAQSGMCRIDAIRAWRV